MRWTVGRLNLLRRDVAAATNEAFYRRVPFSPIGRWALVYAYKEAA